jgi:hypothetical protein
VFEKAQRKVAECTFFLRQLCETQDPDATEFCFNALLNAGTNVVNALHAHLRFYESARMGLPPDAQPVKDKASQVYTYHFQTWEGTLSASHATLFGALQALRNIETHDASRVYHLPQPGERQQPRPVPSDPYYAPIFASYMASGQLSAEVTIPTISYDLWVDTTALKGKYRTLLEQFAQGQQKLSAEVATTYRDLLDSLVAYFITQYVPPV